MIKLVTKKGFEKQINCLLNGNKYGIKYLAVGDGYGSIPTPTEDDTALVHEVWRGEISEVINNAPIFTAIAYIPETVGDFIIRELGLFDENNNLLFVSQMDETPKKATSSGLVKQICVKAIFELQNGLSAIIIDPSTVTASTNFVEENFQKLEAKGQANGYASLDTNGKVPEAQLPDMLSGLPVFCFNSGRVDENGESALCTLENNIITLHAPAVCTTANGKTYKINENKTLDISNLLSESGKLNIFYNVESEELEVYANKVTIEKTEPADFAILDIWVDTSVKPYKCWVKISETENVEKQYILCATLEKISTTNIKLINTLYNISEKDNNSASSGELLDIGFAIAGIDESENKRRYLNGQVIIQDQFPDAVKKLKKLVGWEKTKDNFTKNGNVQVTEQGLASNFSASNFITLPDVFNPGNSPWRFETFISLPTAAADQNITCRTDGNGGCAGINLGITPAGKLAFWLSSNGTSWDIADMVTSAQVLEDDSYYDIVLEFTGSQYILSLKELGANAWTTGATVTSSAIIKPYTQNLGKFYGTNANAFTGTIHLANTFFKVNGETRWEYKTSQATLLPSLVATEENWQAEKTASVFAQVGKFVIDDEAGTVRLPLIKTLQGVYNLINAGLRISQKLPNIRGVVQDVRGVEGANLSTSGALSWQQFDQPWGTRGTQSIKVPTGIVLNAANGSTIYQDGANVQMETLQFPLYIQLATGVEETERPINEYTAAVPYSYGMSQYSGEAMDSACWLKSSGQWNSTGVYTGLTTWIQEKVAAGANNFKTPKGYAYTDSGTGYAFWIATETPVVGMHVYRHVDQYGIKFAISDGKIKTVNSDGSFIYYSSAHGNNLNCSRNSQYDVINDWWIGDYDWVLDSENSRFRFPLKNGKETLIGTQKYKWNIPATPPEVTNNTTIVSVICPVNAMLGLDVNVDSGFAILYASNTRVINYPQSGTDSTTQIYSVKAGKTASISYLGKYHLNSWQDGLYYIPYVGDGDLYFYVGAVEENPGLVNIARIQEELPNKLDKSSIKAYIIGTYRNGSSWYRVYSDGFCEQGFQFNFTGGEGHLNTVNLLKGYSNNDYTVIFNPNTSNHFTDLNKSNSSFTFKTYERTPGATVSGTAVVQVSGYIN